MIERERISWTVEGETLELQTLESQQQTQIKELPIDKLLDKCIVPLLEYNNNNNNNNNTNNNNTNTKRINKDSIDRLNKIIKTVKENKTIKPIVVLQNKTTKKIIRILDGNHRVWAYGRMGKKKILAKIIEVQSLTESQTKVLLGCK